MTKVTGLPCGQACWLSCPLPNSQSADISGPGLGEERLGGTHCHTLSRPHRWALPTAPPPLLRRHPGSQVGQGCPALTTETAPQGVGAEEGAGKGELRGFGVGGWRLGPGTPVPLSALPCFRRPGHGEVQPGSCLHLPFVLGFPEPSRSRQQ